MKFKFELWRNGRHYQLVKVRDKNPCMACCWWDLADNECGRPDDVPSCVLTTVGRTSVYDLAWKRVADVVVTMGYKRRKA
jgi:hypothetical protein